MLRAAEQPSGIVCGHLCGCAGTVLERNEVAKTDWGQLQAAKWYVRNEDLVQSVENHEQFLNKDMMFQTIEFMEDHWGGITQRHGKQCSHP